MPPVQFGLRWLLWEGVMSMASQEHARQTLEPGFPVPIPASPFTSWVALAGHFTSVKSTLSICKVEVPEEAPPNEVGGVNELIHTRHWEEA